MDTSLLLESYLRQYQEKTPQAAVWYSILIDKKSARLMDCDFDLLEPQTWDEPFTDLLFNASINILHLFVRIDAGLLSHAAVQRFFSHTPEGANRLEQLHKLQPTLSAILNKNILWIIQHPANIPFGFTPHCQDWKKIIPGIRYVLRYRDTLPEAFKAEVTEGLLNTKKTLTQTQFMNLAILLAALSPALGPNINARYVDNLKIVDKRDKRRGSILLKRTGTTILRDMIQYQTKVPTLLKPYMPFFDPASFTMDSFFQDMSALYRTQNHGTELQNNELFF